MSWFIPASWRRVFGTRAWLGERAVARLAAIGVTSDAELGELRRRLRWEGRAGLEPLLRKLEAAVEGYRHWFPELRNFERECRIVAPVPMVQEMSAVEWAEYRLLLMKMRAFRASPLGRRVVVGKPSVVVILETTRVGLAAASDAFGGDGFITLTTDEARRWWRRVVPAGTVHPYGWYELLWWKFPDGSDPFDDVQSMREHAGPPPAGTVDWVLGDGHLRGPLAGGGGYERWRWDGERLTYIDGPGGWIS